MPPTVTERSLADHFRCSEDLHELILMVTSDNLRGRPLSLVAPAIDLEVDSALACRSQKSSGRLVKRQLAAIHDPAALADQYPFRWSRQDQRSD